MSLTEVQSLLIPYQINDKIRLGSKNGDGGYIVSKQYLSCYLVSAGCANNTGFEEDYLLHIPDAKIDIYDGTSSCSLAERNTNVTFHRNNVYKLSELGLSNGCNLQMDIEGSELGIFLYPDDDLNKITQMSIEIHLNKIGEERDWIQFLKNINSTHNLIHIHANNYDMSTRYGVPSVLELSYVKSGLISNLIKETSAFPIKGLDVANNRKSNDIAMSWWLC